MNRQALVLKPFQAASDNDSRFSFSQRERYLKTYGSHSLAFSSLQPGMQYFDMPGIGYIPYMKKWGSVFVLSNPICAHENLEIILAAFNERFPNASYMQVSKPVVDIMHRRYGFYGTRFGAESRIHLADWNLDGKRKQVLRTAINRARHSGIIIEEGFHDEDTVRISESWLSTRRCKRPRVRFMIRPLEMHYKENERRFYAYRDGKAIGFIFFDPIYSDNRIISYVPSISRASSQFKQGIFYVLMAHAIQVFRTEGVPYTDLGLIPLLPGSHVEPQEARILRHISAFIHERGGFLYNFKGIAFTKTRFNGQLSDTYCCHKRAVPLIEFISICRLTRVL